MALDLVDEKICLEGFQSGLSWLTILRKREGFRRMVNDHLSGCHVRAGCDQDRRSLRPGRPGRIRAH